MAIPVIMPKFEMSQEMGLLIEWLKNDGDHVEKGEPIFIVETDKLTMEVESPGEGILGGLSAQAGDNVPVTRTIAYILADGESVPENEVPMPEEGEMENEVSSKGEKDSQKKSSPIAQRLIDEKNLDINNIPSSSSEGRITQKDVITYLASQDKLEGEKTRATPAARRIARTKNVDLLEKGSGPIGRVQEQDMLDLIQSAETGAALQTGQIIPLEGMRKIIAERMLQSYQNAPHIHLTVSVDMGNISVLRKILNEKYLENKGVRVSVTAILVFLLSRVLKDHPIINSSIDDVGITLRESINVGVAVALENGLIVPVIKEANLRTILEIAKEVIELARKSRENDLMPEDITGGTFTVTNLGPYGIDEFTAIINPGQAGILAVGAIKDEVVPVNGVAVIRPMMRITLAVDHRIIDGAGAAKFLKDLKKVFENPSVLLFSD